jgi:N6-adenosine-specific RNA methylase IME4
MEERLTPPFTTAIIDPPWRYRSVSSSPRLSGYVSQKDNVQYTTMHVDEMKPLPIAALVSKYVFVWTVGPFIRESLALLDAWGFEYKSQLCWIKEDKQLGVGHWFRGNHELIFVGKRPDVKSIITGESSVLWHPRIGHSQKPVMLHDLIEKHFEGPYVEIFGRRPHANWTVFGNELEPNLFNDEVGGFIQGDVRTTINEFISQKS